MAITVVQKKTGSTVGATTIAITFTSPPTNGNNCFALIGTASISSTPVSGVAQTGATYTKDKSILHTLGALAAGGTSDLWSSGAVSSAGSTVTATLASSLHAEMQIIEVSGLATSSMLDKTASSQGDVSGGG